MRSSRADLVARGHLIANEAQQKISTLANTQGRCWPVYWNFTTCPFATAKDTPHLQAKPETAMIDLC
jgi:hypothetical protein